VASWHGVFLNYLQQENFGYVSAGKVCSGEKISCLFDTKVYNGIKV